MPNPSNNHILSPELWDSDRLGPHMSACQNPLQKRDVITSVSHSGPNRPKGQRELTFEIFKNGRESFRNYCHAPHQAR
jgi:hypothetical protein